MPAEGDTEGMKVNTLLRPWKGDKRFTRMSQQAAAWKKSGKAEPEILAALEAEYGRPAPVPALREAPAPLHLYGEVGDDINPVAVSQLMLALRLPIALEGALMPDAHVGYALPIGGVFAAHRAVSPAMVGVDIGCRMHLSLFAVPPDEFRARREALFRDLHGRDDVWSRRRQCAACRTSHPGQRPLAALTSQTRGLREKARRQLGTSGSGNHFAELIVGERLGRSRSAMHRALSVLPAPPPDLRRPADAQRFARESATPSRTTTCGWPRWKRRGRRASRRCTNGWSLDEDAGREYWAAMELAGDFARANHEVIHEAFARRSGLTPLATVQNHHNFAWMRRPGPRHPP